MRMIVIGHVEWVEFVRVAHVTQPGEIQPAVETWSEPGASGGVAAVRLAALAGGSTLFTALGDDELGHRAKAQLEQLGVRVEVAWRPEAQRRAIVFLDRHGERAITVIGTRHGPRLRDELPWHELDDAEGVYVTAADPELVARARKAKVLVATSRVLDTVARSGVSLDALVGSGEDPAERYEPGSLFPPPRLFVATAGHLGGWSRPGGPYRAAELPGPPEDAYGCGDSFAAGITFGLASGLTDAAAIALACREGALARCRRGAHGG